jgi:hypothetical protein
MRIVTNMPRRSLSASRAVLGVTLLSATFVPLNAQVFTKQAPAAKPNPGPQAPRKKPVQQRAPGPVRSVRPVERSLPPFVGAVPRAMLGKWVLTAKSGALQSTFLSGIEIQGGEIGTIIGGVAYWLLSPGNEASPSCQGSFMLTAVEGQTLVIDERVGAKDIFCPGDKTIKMQLTGDRLYVEWSRKKKDQKVTMQGWATRVSASTR